MDTSTLRLQRPSSVYTNRFSQRIGVPDPAGGATGPRFSHQTFGSAPDRETAPKQVRISAGRMKTSARARRHRPFAGTPASLSKSLSLSSGSRLRETADRHSARKRTGSDASHRSSPAGLHTKIPERTAEGPFGDRNVVRRHKCRRTMRKFTCGIPSRTRRWRFRRAPLRCGAAGCIWPCGPNATWNRS